MYANEQKMNRSKLFAAIAVFAMIACAFAVILPADGVNGEALSITNAPAEGEEGVTYVNTEQAFNEALVDEDVKTIVINFTAEDEPTTWPAVLDLSSSTVTIPKDKTLFIGTEYSINGSMQNGTNDVDKTTVQIKFGNLVVEGTVYNLIGANQKTSGLWVDNLTMSGTGKLFSTSAIKATEGATDRNGFYTSTPYVANTYRQYYTAQLIDIDDYVVANTYSGQGISTAEKAIFSYGTTSVTSADNKATLSDIGVYLNPDSTMTVEEGAKLAPSKVVVKVDSNDDTRKATLVNNGETTLGANSQIAGTYTNNGTTTVTGTVTGTINSAEDATVTLANTVSDVTGLSLNGGVLDNQSSTKPVLESGVQYVGADGKKYIATSIATSDLYTIIIGINAVDYKPGMNYAGTNSSISIDRYAIFDMGGKEVDASKYTYRFLTPNAIYYDENDAKLDNKNYGTVTEVGTYYMSMSIAYGVPSADDSGTTVVTGEFKILPVEATVVITGTELVDPENPESGYKIPNQTYYESEDGVTLTEGEDFTFKVTVDGVEVPADSYTYEITYQDNTKAGNAMVIVTVSGNYSGSDDEVFIIDSKVLSLTVTPVDAEKDYHVGESVSTTDFTIVGNNDDGTTNSTLDASKITVSPETFTEAGEIVVTFTYENADGTEATGEATVTVHGVAAIEITAEPTDAEKGYMAGATISTAGMSVTVTYDDEATAVFAGSTDGKGLVKTGGSAVDPYFIFDSLTLNYGIGDEVPVKVTYFGVSDEFYVKVTGYLINYVYYQGETEVLYATQAGSEGAAIVYNFAIASPVNGESFTGWLVEGTSSMYLPGTQIEYGADKNLWGEGNIITLIAQFGGTGTVTPEPVDPATDVKVYIGFTETGVELMFYGVDGYVPANITFTLTYTYTVVIGDVTYTTPGFIESTTVTNENNSTVVIVPIEPEMLEGGILYGAYATVTIGDLTFNTPMITHVA